MMIACDTIVPLVLPACYCALISPDLRETLQLHPSLIDLEGTEMAEVWVILCKIQFYLYKSLSPQDVAAYIYVFCIENKNAFVDGVVFKVGRTNDVERRKKEWAAQCLSQQHKWYDPVLVRYSHRTERLVHLELAKICLRKPNEICTDCGRRHCETFELQERDGEDAFEGLISPIIKEMAAASLECRPPRQK
ncbi:hypothetical protein PM082_015135 [Marasmius tenuissimus]|nr:hypothetical protein PM082_015135 [Marasmius tenuissimus]